MSVQEFHEMCTASKERYIDRKSGTCFTLDYNEQTPYVLFRENFRIYKENMEKRVVSVWALVDHNGQPVVVVEFQ